MDINQAARMIEWLDEERRKDKTTIATLEERLQQQSETISQLLRRLGGVENDQASMRGAYMPQAREPELVEQLRFEMQQMVEQLEARRLSAERETERRASISRDGIVRPMRELGDRLDRIERGLDELQAIRAEQDRISAMIPPLQQRLEDLAKKLDEPDRRLTYLEEQRRSDSRRLSEVQSELPEIQKQIERIAPKLTLLEEMALRNEKRVMEVQSGERERREQIQQFVEQQNLSMHTHQIRIEELGQRIGVYDQDMQRNFERFESWAEAYRQMKRVIEDFERIGERLERRINEVAEMQRLSEDRFRQEWNNWTADDQKRWKQFTLTNDEAWRGHEREFENIRAELTRLGERLAPLGESVERLWGFERAQATLFREQLQTLLDHYDSEGVSRTPPAGPGNGSAAGAPGGE